MDADITFIRVIPASVEAVVGNGEQGVGVWRIHKKETNYSQKAVDIKKLLPTASCLPWVKTHGY